MVFSSLIFLYLFLPAFLLSYFLIPSRFVTIRNLVLLIFSSIFYIWGDPSAIYLLCITICISWIGGIIIGKAQNSTLRFLALSFFVCLSLVSLGWYKYANFFIANLNEFLLKINLPEINFTKNIAMPIGISFYTFHIISYLVDIYRRKVRSSKNIINFATYIMMFPQLVAGPIIRYSTIEKQINQRTTNSKRIVSGIKRCLVGLYKKVLIANFVALPANQIFALDQTELTTPLIWLAVIAYTLQIYFDFSAYSDMAIGLGRIMGFNFIENFRRPYLALDIREFWRKWHISLSTWFRDYVYIPLGGNKGSKFKAYANLWIVFLLCGFWHGANWTFIVWGIYHGTFLVIERSFAEKIALLPTLFRRFYVLLVVMIGWVFFRADSISQALGYLKLMFLQTKFISIRPSAEFFTPYYLFIFILAILIVFKVPQNLITKTYKYLLKRQLKYLFELTYLFYSVVLFIFTYANLLSGSYNPFIYYRF